MVGWGEGWVEKMGYVCLLCIPLSGVLCRALKSEDIVWCSCAAYVCSFLVSFTGRRIILSMSDFPSLPAMVAMLVGGVFLAIALAVGVLLLSALFDREEA